MLSSFQNPLFINNPKPTQAIEENLLNVPEITPAPTVMPIFHLFDREDYQVGDIVYFGEFEQDGNPSAAEPLEWYVTGVRGSAVKLLSRYVIVEMDFSPYMESNFTGTEGHWEFSTIREWLNGKFYKTAYTDEERKEILKVRLITTYYDSTNNPVEKETDDHIFIPTTKEIKELKMDLRYGIPTEYAVQQGVIEYGSGHTRWWDREPEGVSQNSVSYVRDNGELADYIPSYEQTGVRPEMWVNIER